MRPHLIDRQNVGMIQCRCCPRLLLKAPQTVGIGREASVKFADDTKALSNLNDLPDFGYW